MKFLPFIVLLCLAQSVYAQIVNTDSFKLINSPFDELQPVLSPDRKTLFFTVANHPKNIGGKKDPGDIWLSILVDDKWNAPIHGGQLLNDNGYNAVAGISLSGNQLFLLGHYNETGGIAKTQGISISKNDGHGWSRPENISIPYFQNKSHILSGHITADKGVFIFSAETYGTRGVEDIYVSLNEDGRWTEARNLGSKINTQFQELSPSLSEDGKTLFYSSNGRKGKGSFDVYVSKRLDDTWSNWSEPVSITEGVNSEGRELFYREFNDLGFSIFTSTKNSDGYGDINIYHPAKGIEPDTVKAVVQIYIDTIAQVKKVVEVVILKDTITSVRIYGKVTNAKTGEPINASIRFSSSTIKNIATSGLDGFTVNVPVSQYTVNIEASGYVSAIEKFDIQGYEMNELEMNFKLQPVEIGTRVNLRNVLFERGTSTLLPESNDELDLIATFLNANPSIKIELNGHTDNRGVHVDNVKLSQERVNKVKQYLITKGIEAKRMTGKGYGGAKPIASNDSEETRKLNRRVEFTIKKF